MKVATKQRKSYLTKTKTHCKTPATPVHADGLVFTRASCISKPTEAANETKETTYAIKSQSFNLQFRKQTIKTNHAK